MIKLLVLDVDGTLTDGGVYIDGSGSEFKRFDIQDGMGIVLLQKSSVHVAIISGRYSKATQQRAKELGISLLYNGVLHKLRVLQELAEELDFSREEISFAGDDVNDIDCMEWAGLSFAVANARPAVKKIADHVTTSKGGHGAVREICEKIIYFNSLSFQENINENV